jgi:AcrR family transcriptional regulator
MAKRATALPPEERRSMIVDVTLPLLLQHGELVTTRQIAEAAGIAEGTIFRAFTDKDAVIEAVLEAALDTAELERDLAAINPDLSFEEALVAAVKILQRRVVDIWRLVSSINRFHDKARRPVMDSDALIALFKQHRGRLRVPPRVAARHLRTLTLSATHPMMIDEAATPREIVSLFLHGVAAC